MPATRQDVLKLMERANQAAAADGWTVNWRTDNTSWGTWRGATQSWLNKTTSAASKSLFAAIDSEAMGYALKCTKAVYGRIGSQTPYGLGVSVRVDFFINDQHDVQQHMDFYVDQNDPKGPTMAYDSQGMRVPRPSRRGLEGGTCGHGTCSMDLVSHVGEDGVWVCAGCAADLNRVYRRSDRSPYYQQLGSL